MTSGTVDFLRKPGQPLAGWLLAALGLACLAGCIVLERQVRMEAAQLQQQQLELAEKREAHKRATRPAPPSVSDKRRETLERILQQPWLPVLRVVEDAAAPPVHLLSLSLEGKSGILQLEGEVPSYEEALAFVAALRNEDILTETQLRSHEQVSDPSTGRSSVRFRSDARWVSP